MPSKTVILTTPIENIKNSQVIDNSLNETQTLKSPDDTVTLKDQITGIERTESISGVSLYDDVIVDTQGQAHKILQMQTYNI